MRPVSVGRAVAAFLVAGLLAITALGVLLALAQRRLAVSEAIRDARTVTELEAHDVVCPHLVNKALDPGPERDALDAVVRDKVLGSRVVRVKVWDDTGRIVYSDDTSLIGRRFALPASELRALRTGSTVAEVTDLRDAENVDERSFGKLLQVYLGVVAPGGRRLLFETYQPYDVISQASRRMLVSSLPVLLGGLVLLYVVQAPLAYRMAVRLRTAQDTREQLLVATLAASDRERGSIAADLHDGVLQELAAAGLGLTAAAASARSAGQPAVADTVARTAADLRRWVRELRSLVVTITPPALQQQGLPTSLEDLAATLEAHAVAVRVQVSGTEGLAAADEALAYRVAQEAVRNVVRHAKARRVALTLTVEPSEQRDLLLLEVADDGRGFDTTAPVRGRGSVGLELLTALVTGHGGHLDVESTPGRGTTVRLRLPVDRAAQPTAAPPAPLLPVTGRR